MEVTEKKENILKKVLKIVFNKNNLPIVLFFIVFINYLPLIMKNINVKTSNAVNVKEMTIAFGIECVLLFIYLIRSIKFDKKFLINILLLVFTTVAMGIVQFCNYKNGNLQSMDIANIICIAINIAALYIAFLNVSIEENNIYKFFVGIVIIGLFSCIVNIILYKKEMLRLLGIGGENIFFSIKSFFAHRNQYACFLYFSLVSNVFLFIKSDKKIWKIVLGITFIIFSINLALTASRTGIFCTAMFLGLFFLFTDKLKIKTKIIIIAICIIVLGIFGFIIFKNYSELWQKGINTIQKIFIRESTIKNFTGRSDFWVLATDVLFVTPVTAIFGVGRFVGINLLQASGYNVTQFHNFYVEALVAGGVMELVYLLSIYAMVMINIIKSKIEKKYKILYICLYISYALYCGFESLGRFSIGCVDTICLIYLITIPFLHSNTIRKNKEIEGTKEIDKLEGEYNK